MGGWCAVYLADTLLRSSATHRISYESWLASRGLMLSPFHVRWQTTMFNRLFAHCARINPRALYLWFNSGLVFGVVAMFGSVVLLVRTLQQTYAQMTTDNPRIGGQQALQVVVPGVNLPTSQLAYFFSALLLSGILHELGHAVAALREQVRVNGFGMFVFVVYPGAFVDLFTTHLNLISPTQQLRIFCAGASLARLPAVTQLDLSRNKRLFNSGLVFGVVAMFGSVVLLVRTLQQTYAQMTTDNPRIGGQQALQVVVPGVNLPTSQLAYFFSALLLSGILHELGHAVAALREQVRVNGFGMFVFVVYPGAFVDLFTTHLNLISPTQQLRIFCRGVWHNFVLCLLALAFLFLLPILLLPLYSTGAGALVTEVVPGSAADGPRGLAVGDIVTAMEDCPVRGVEDWTACLSRLSREPQTGYCVPAASLQPSWAHGRGSC
ncbi:unnamed protein product [Menidia menidia]|uniref:Membrane-bound transcription factor site-2 protease n=1 Tax=Menidia menidia TaxID=238744 RepID=A0A8S4AX31_9TELE|nr:unnamed protein product [Menidia menidia]